MKTDKLAEEIDRLLNKYVITDPEGVGTDCFFWDDVKDLANEYAGAYHKAKLAETTDEDIEKWVDDEIKKEPMLGYSRAMMIYSAKAFKNGEIGHKDIINEK